MTQNVLLYKTNSINKTDEIASSFFVLHNLSILGTNSHKQTLIFTYQSSFHQLYTRKTALTYLSQLKRNFAKTHLDNIIYYINSLRNERINRMENSGVVFAKSEHS